MNYNDYKKLIQDRLTLLYPDIGELDINDPANIFIDIAAYMASLLDYQIDYRLAQNLLTTATNKKDLLKIARAFGYKPKLVTTANTTLDIYQLLPATVTGEPNYDYALIIDSLIVDNGAGVSFIATKSVDFTVNNYADRREISVYSYNNNNIPTWYLMKKQVNAYAAKEKTYTYYVQNNTRYLEIELPDPDIIEIVNVVDNTGRKWYEVNSLAQDTVMIEEYTGNEIVPYNIKYIRTPYRFETYVNDDERLVLRFGSGVEFGQSEQIIPNPDNIALNTNLGRQLGEVYDISNFLYTNTYGCIVPKDTTLFITYRYGGGSNTNCAANTINKINTIVARPKATIYDAELYNKVINSVTANNPSLAVGGVDYIDIEKIRSDIVLYLNSQNRAVTREDYEIATMSMPSKFGVISKVFVTTNREIYNDNMGSNNINVYILTYTTDKKLAYCNDEIKNNLQKWLYNYKLLSDSINIMDAYIVNIRVYYDIVVNSNVISSKVLFDCNNALKNYFDINKWKINQPIDITEIYNILLAIEGVRNVKNVKIINQFSIEDNKYSSIQYDIDTATRDNVVYPPADPAIFEVRYPDEDIYGKAIIV